MNYFCNKGKTELLKSPSHLILQGVCFGWNSEFISYKFHKISRLFCATLLYFKMLLFYCFWNEPVYFHDFSLMNWEYHHSWYISFLFSFFSVLELMDFYMELLAFLWKVHIFSKYPIKQCSFSKWIHGLFSLSGKLFNTSPLRHKKLVS